jgi:putative acetyltransferase
MQKQALMSHKTLSGSNMIIREERPGDVETISSITESAFANHAYSRNTEHFIIKALRKSNAMTISLVAEINGKTVGHIAFSPVTLSDGSHGWYGLGPISVLPEFQRQDIGTQLVNEGLRLLKKLNAAGCVLVGDPAYYKRLGFESPPKLKHEGVPQENLLTLLFRGSIPEGFVYFHEAFGADS